MVSHQDEPTKDAGPRLLICGLRKTTGRRANPAFPKGSRRIQQRQPRRPFSDDVVNLRTPPENVLMGPYLNGHGRGEQSWPSLETSPAPLESKVVTLPETTLVESQSAGQWQRRNPCSHDEHPGR